jgi:hypothetical protein
MGLIRATFTTMGQSSPASVAEGTGYYVYGGDKPHQETGKSRMARDRSHVSKDKAGRFAEFRRLVEQDNLTVAEAGERLGIAINTARSYERERKAQQRRESGDD